MKKFLRILAAIILPLIAVGIVLLLTVGIPGLGALVGALNGSFYVYPLVVLIGALVVFGTYKVLGLFAEDESA